MTRPSNRFALFAGRKAWLVAVGAGIALTAINMFGGFAVTRRMLAMFRK